MFVSEIKQSTFMGIYN